MSRGNPAHGKYGEKAEILVLSVLMDGPASPREISDETGIPWRCVSSYLSGLASQGLIKKFGGSGVRGNPYIWSIADA